MTVTRPNTWTPMNIAQVTDCPVFKSGEIGMLRKPYPP